MQSIILGGSIISHTEMLIISLCPPTYVCAQIHTHARACDMCMLVWRGLFLSYLGRVIYYTYCSAIVCIEYITDIFPFQYLQISNILTKAS